MKKVIKEYTIYRYNELSEEAKEKVKNDYLNDFVRNEDFQYTCEEDVANLFPNSDLQVQYSLSCSQGDGLNIYGRLNISDILNTITEQFTEKEKRTLLFYFRYSEDYILLPWNHRHSYCFVDKADIIDTVIDNMEYYHVHNINYELLKKFENAVIKFITNLCNTLEDIGYDYLYNISDEEMEDISEANEWEYYQNGELY